MQTKNSGNTTGPRSLLRIFKILELIARAPEGLTLTDLSRQLDAPKSSLSALLKPLTAHGYLRFDQGRYGFGNHTFRLCADILSARSFTRIIRPFLEELSVRSTESAYLVMIDRDMGVASYVEGIESQNTIRYVAPPGTVRPLYVSAAGKALLAFQEEAWRERYLKTTKLVSPATQQVIDTKELKKELLEIRRSRLATSISTAVQGAAGIAAPLLITGEPVSAVLLVSAPADRLIQSQTSLKKILLEVAERASAYLAGMSSVNSSGRSNLNP